MTQFRRGLPEEMPDILDFGNYVFSHAHRPHDFRSLIPKVYGEGHEDSAAFHFLALEEGRIRGMIAAYPHQYHVGSEVLNTRFIGTVSVHPYSRGSGYMKHLMQDVEDACIAENVDIAFLGGQRQRYRYFGYEVGGMAIRFDLSKACLKHTEKPEEERISLVPIEEDDLELQNLAFDFYETRPVTGRSREEFYEVLCTWNSRPFAVFLDADCVGYMVANGNTVFEETMDPELLPSVLSVYMRDYGPFDGLKLMARAYEKDVIDVLSDIAENSSIVENHQFKIYNWPKVLKAFLELKNSHDPLSDGCLSLTIEGEGSVLIVVSEGKVEVQEYETDEPDLVLKPTQAIRTLTTPEYWYRGLHSDKIPEGWFPLTFGLTALDEF